LRVKFGQSFLVIGHSKNGRGWPVNPASQNGKNGCQGQAPAALSRAARLWRHPCVDGWAWLGRHAFELGHKGCSPLGGIRKGGSPYGAVQPPGGSGVQGPDSEAPWRGTSLAMYNLAIPTFAFFLCCRGGAAKPSGHGIIMGGPGRFCRHGENGETRTQSQSPDVTDERL
jgi:hypothetical protein